MPYVEPKPDSDNDALEWPPRCPWCGWPTEPLEEMLAGRYRLQRPKYHFWCRRRHETDKVEN